MSIKPIVQIRDAAILGNRLTGIPSNHPSCYVSNTKPIITSEIIRHNQEEVETLNTIYKVESWYDSSNLASLCLRS